MRTPELHHRAIRALQACAAADTAAYFALEPGGSFALGTLQIEATACRARAS